MEVAKYRVFERCMSRLRHAWAAFGGTSDSGPERSAPLGPGTTAAAPHQPSIASPRTEMPSAFASATSRMRSSNRVRPTSTAIRLIPALAAPATV